MTVVGCVVTVVGVLSVVVPVGVYGCGVVFVVTSTGTHFETGQQASVSRTTARYPSGHGHSPSSTHLDLLQVHS